MEKNTKQIQHSHKSCSVGILFLRLFIGGVMLLHIIGKMQTYDNLVLEYNSFLGLSRATSLALSLIIEGLLAAMIIMGVATRLAAMLMVVITFISLVDSVLMGSITLPISKTEVLYLGIFLTLSISGGGLYAFHVPILRGKYGPNR